MSDENLCEFCELDGYGNHAARCPVTLEAQLEKAEQECRTLEHNLADYKNRALDAEGALPGRLAEIASWRDEAKRQEARAEKAEREREGQRQARWNLVAEMGMVTRAAVLRHDLEAVRDALRPHEQGRERSDDEPPDSPADAGNT